MKLRRDMSGADLAHALEKFGYEITRQTGSHLRLSSRLKGEHHITIPLSRDLILPAARIRRCALERWPRFYRELPPISR